MCRLKDIEGGLLDQQSVQIGRSEYLQDGGF